MLKNENNADNENEVILTSEEQNEPTVRPSISIRTRLIIAFLLIFALCTIITLWSIFTIAQVMDKIHFLETSDNYKAEIQETRRFEKNYLLYGTNLDDAKMHVYNAEKILRENVETIEKILGPTDFNTMNNQLADYNNLLTKLGDTQDKEEKKNIENALRDHGSQMVERALDFERIERNSVEEMLVLARRIPFIFLILLLLCIVFIVSFLARQLLGTLARFMEYTERIGEGDFSPIAPQRKYRDEFSQLRMAFNKMIKEIDRRERIMVESHKLRAVGTLVAGVAHELNNPLNNTMLTASMLQEDYQCLKDDEKIEMISDIISETERSQKVVHNLLDFAREGEMKLITLNLNEIIEDSINLVANQLKLSQINLVKNLASNLTPIYGDAHMLQQVIINLILNASDVLSKKGIITVNTYKSKEEDYVVVEIKDNGPGIPEHVLLRIFEPFFTTKSLRKGTGLGLSVSKGIVNKLGGYITAESKPGEGASFKVFLLRTNIPLTTSSV